jgi:hypothetical protein
LSRLDLCLLSYVNKLPVEGLPDDIYGTTE